MIRYIDRVYHEGEGGGGTVAVSRSGPVVHTSFCNWLRESLMMFFLK